MESSSENKIIKNIETNWLPSGGLQKFQNLVELNITHDQTLNELPANLFDGLSFLKSIKIVSCNIIKIGYGCFHKLRSQLEICDLTNNSMIDYAFYKHHDDIGTFSELIYHTDLISIDKPISNSITQQLYTGLWNTDHHNGDFNIFINNKHYKVHKVILQKDSIIFREMFKRFPDLTNGRFENVSLTTVAAFLKYLYIPSPPIEFTHFDDVFELYLVASKYNISGLENYTLIQLASILSVENVSQFISKLNLIKSDLLIKFINKVANRKFKKPTNIVYPYQQQQHNRQLRRHVKFFNSNTIVL
jgi:hypothetical protein